MYNSKIVQFANLYNSQISIIPAFVQFRTMSTILETSSDKLNVACLKMLHVRKAFPTNSEFGHP